MENTLVVLGPTIAGLVAFVLTRLRALSGARDWECSGEEASCGLAESKAN